MTTAPPPGDAVPIAVVAGGGDLPAEVVSALAASGRRAVVIALAGEADPALTALGAHWIEWGQIGRALDLAARENCRDIVLVGSVSRRPNFRAVAADFGTLRRLPRILAALVGGDDSVLRKVIRLFEIEGLVIRGVDEVAPQLLAPAGRIGARPADRSAADIARGAAVVAALGPFDVGQASIVVDGRIVAIEGAEGTDRLIQRVGELKAAGRVGRGGVLVKRSKPGQDLRVDLPTIGPVTVAAVAEAGLEGIAVEAGRVLIARRAETVAAADRAGIFLHGLSAAELSA